MLTLSPTFLLLRWNLYKNMDTVSLCALGKTTSYTMGLMVEPSCTEHDTDVTFWFDMCASEFASSGPYLHKRLT